MSKNKKEKLTPPDDFDNLRTLIIKQRNSLPKRLTQVAEYALQYPDEIAFGTTKSIADAAGAQPSTMVRLANQLGYDGFSSFQKVFRDRLRSRPISYEERFETLESRIGGGSEGSMILKGFLNAARKSLDIFEADIDLDMLKKSIDVLSGAETIYLIAKRRSYPLIALMAYIFGKRQIRYHIVGSTIGNDNDILESAGPKDAALAVSFSPYAQETITQIQLLAKNQVPIVAITDSAFSPLATYSSIWHEVVETDYSGFRSLSSSFVLTATLSVAVARHRRRMQKTETEKKTTSNVGQGAKQ